MRLSPAPKNLYSGAYIYTQPKPIMCTAGPILNSCMYILCVDSYGNPDQLEQLFVCCEWICALPGSAIRYYIREDRMSLAYLIDPLIIRKPKLDYIL